MTAPLLCAKNVPAKEAEHRESPGRQNESNRPNDTHSCLCGAWIEQTNPWMCSREFYSKPHLVMGYLSKSAAVGQGRSDGLSPQISKMTGLPRARSCGGWAVGWHPVMPPPFSPCHCNLTGGIANARLSAALTSKLLLSNFIILKIRFTDLFIYFLTGGKNKEKQSGKNPSNKQKTPPQSQPKAPGNTRKINKVGHGTSALNCAHLTRSSERLGNVREADTKTPGALPESAAAQSDKYPWPQKTGDKLEIEIKLLTPCPGV